MTYIARYKQVSKDFSMIRYVGRRTKVYTMEKFSKTMEIKLRNYERRLFCWASNV